MTKTIQIRKKGSVTIPMEIRKRYQLDEGDPLTLIDLGEGFSLSPKRSVLPKLVAGSTSKAGSSFMLLQLCELNILHGLTSSQVVEECKVNLHKKLPEAELIMIDKFTCLFFFKHLFP